MTPAQKQGLIADLVQRMRNSPNQYNIVQRVGYEGPGRHLVQSTERPSAVSAFRSGQEYFVYSWEVVRATVEALRDDARGS